MCLNTEGCRFLEIPETWSQDSEPEKNQRTGVPGPSLRGYLGKGSWPRRRATARVGRVGVLDPFRSKLLTQLSWSNDILSGRGRLQIPFPWYLAGTVAWQIRLSTWSLKELRSFLNRLDPEAQIILNAYKPRAPSSRSRPRSRSRRPPSKFSLKSSFEPISRLLRVEDFSPVPNPPPLPLSESTCRCHQWLPLPLKNSPYPHISQLH